MVLKPQGYYTPTSGDADSWDDTSGFELHGTEVGTITFTGNQATFDGASYYDLPDSQFLDYIPTVDEFTIIYREGDTAPTTSGYALSKRTNTTKQYGIVAYNGGNLQLNYMGGLDESIAAAALNNNRLIIVVVQTSQLDVWVDGVQIVAASSAVGTEVSPGQSANIGGRSDGSYLFNSGASVDIIATIPKAISTAERLAIEAEFKVNGVAADLSTNPTGFGDAPVFYINGNKKFVKGN